MEFIKMDLNNINLNELLQIMDKNHEIAKIKSAEILKINNFQNSEKPNTIKKENKSTIKKAENTPKPDSSSEFEEEIKDYLEKLNKLSLKDIDTKIKNILPSKLSYNYERIIYRLQLEVLKNLNELDEFTNDEKANFSAVDLIDIELEKKLEMKKLALLKASLCEEKQEKSPETENTLIFVPTTGGNIRVLNEFQKIPFEYYDSFLDLLLTIKNGTFKNFKRFYNNANMTGISEVKGYQVRIIFDRLDKDKYAIISAFLKKTTIDKGYLDSLYQKIGDYYNIKEKIKSMLYEEDFLNLNKQYEEEIFNLLSGEKESSKEKVMKND